MARRPPTGRGAVAGWLLAATAALAQGDPGSLPAAADAGGADANPPGGRLTLQWRPRASFAQQSNKPRHAEAYNLRTLLGWASDPVDDWRGVVQLVDVRWHHPLRASNRPGDPASPYPLVADPEVTSLNQLYLEHTGLAETTIRIGRQPIRLDNERFVGDADTRQIPQVFDAITVRNTSLPRTRLFAALTRQVRTYHGTTLPSRSILLNARADVDPAASVGAYAYFVGQPRSENITLLADNSHRTAGVRLEGNVELGGDWSLYYAAEAARQQAWNGGDPLIRAGYRRLAIGPTYGGFSLQLGEERLGSHDGLYGLQTPLSYNVFQGWAYQFFNTPRNGVRDRSVAAALALGRAHFWLKAHRFDAAWGGTRHGREWDFAAAVRLRADLSLRLVHADFRQRSVASRPTARRTTLTLQYDY